MLFVWIEIFYDGWWLTCQILLQIPVVINVPSQGVMVKLFIGVSETSLSTDRQDMLEINFAKQKQKMMNFMLVILFNQTLYKN